jgi:stage II sporulation protein AB (anti-sigma F factor)
MDNFMNLKISAKSKNEAFARSAVAAFCVELNPTLDLINDIKTAVSEAVTNSIVHGYGGAGGGIIEIEAYLEDKTVHIEIKDSGVGIENIEEARRPFFTTKPEQERSGMGFTVMETFMDSLEVAPNAGGGLAVRMTKNLDTDKRFKKRED